jgi:hypothetical protein
MPSGSTPTTVSCIHHPSPRHGKQKKRKVLLQKKTKERKQKKRSKATIRSGCRHARNDPNLAPRPAALPLHGPPVCAPVRPASEAARDLMGRERGSTIRSMVGAWAGGHGCHPWPRSREGHDMSPISGPLPTKATPRPRLPHPAGRLTDDDYLLLLCSSNSY